MAYPKITVNTGLSLSIIASDTLPIPAPDLPQITGTADTDVTNKLKDTTANFSTVNVGDIVYNTTDNTSGAVTAVDSTDTISFATDLFPDGNENYIIFTAGPVGFNERIASGEGCLLYVGSSLTTMTVAGSFVNVKVKTTAGSIVTFSNFPVGEYLPVQVVQLFKTGTTDEADNNCIAIW
tara:strand:+ start:4630 stop:5169 length:540 start_codon:yes stop_codon:yes gene_type:complete